MELGSLVKMFVGADGDKHTLEVGLTDLRDWLDDQMRLHREKCDFFEETIALKAAIEQALDDMGDHGHCVCEQVKQELKSMLLKYDRKSNP